MSTEHAKTEADSLHIGYVVLARRPNQPPEPVSAVFPAYPKGLEQAQNVLESNEVFGKKLKNAGYELDPVEYVIGQISEWSGA